jgi:hypothetical protein
MIKPAVPAACMVVLVGATTVARAADPDTLALSFTSTAETEGLQVTDEQPIVLLLTHSCWSSAAHLTASLPPDVDVDALSLVGPGDVVLSTDIGFVHDGTVLADEDLVRLADGMVTVLFDGSLHGLPDAADIDAVHVVSVDPLEFYYSLATANEIDGVIYSDDDIIHFEAGAHELWVSGSDLFGSRHDGLDVDALWVDPLGRDLLLSTDVGCTGLGGVTRADDEDVLRYRRMSGELLLFVDLSGHGVDTGRVDVDALHALQSLIFADDFETGDTSRWSRP